MDKQANRLIREKSPYLLQHAHNPVDWYPWGEEAFAKAKREDKPVFLSIGYSTCHWCHVMERESFEDREVAAVLNRDFVCIKVDREERPDIDHIYMGVCQAMTGQGGWPLTVILTPAGKPFFAGTYFPKRANWMRAGLMNILAAVRGRWQEERKEILGYSERLVLALQRQAAKPRGGKPLTEDILTKGFRQLAEIFEPNYGGFGGSPKFPTPHNLMFLLRYWRRSGEHAALRMVEKTLTAMWQGGIYDHLGYGFARYSTDGKWLVPHFEKMLYDNALLCYTYLEAYQCTDNEDYARVAEEILTYVLRDMTDEQGGFYSAEDADSEGAEGRFYVFARHEILDVLGEHDGCIFADFYDVTGRGNFEHGVNVLHRIGRDTDRYAANMEMSRADLEELLDNGRRKLFRFRDRRVHPFKDDKILTAWNALMIAALAKAARVLNNDTYAVAGERALDFIFRRLQQGDGRLLARYRAGEAAYPAYLDDYAFLLWALLDMYETTFKLEYLRRAVTIAGAMKRLFWDAEQGGFYFYGADAEQLVNRQKEFYDGALPSGNSVAAWALLKLAVLTGESGLLELAEHQMQACSEEVARTPMAYAFFLTALDYYLSARRKVVVVGDSDSRDTWAMLGAVGRRFLPDTAVMLSDVSEQHSVKAAADSFSELQDYQPVAGRPAAYICENFSCQPPVTELQRFLHDLEGK